MIRQFVSILMIFAVLASHLAAAVPHTHAGMSAAERALHDSVPHVHAGWPTSWHSHGSHAHRGHSHQGHSHAIHEGHRLEAGHVPAEAEGWPDSVDDRDGTPGESIPAHDTDAAPIHLALAVIGNSSQSSVRESSAVGEPLYGDACSNWLNCSSVDGQTDFPMLFAPPPENWQNGSLIYLLTRRLRL